MYNITNSDIQDCIQNCKSAMTVKGPIIGYAIGFGGKNIENRSRKIKNGWYALHIGGSKQANPKHMMIYSLLDSFEKNKMPPRSAIIGCFKINGYINQSNNKWFIGPYGNIIEKYINFEEPILNIPGHQSVTYSLETIDKKLLKKYGEQDKLIKNRITDKLNKLLVSRMNSR